MSTPEKPLEEAIEDLVAARLPGARVLEIRAFGIDQTDREATAKAFGYGKPLRITVSEQTGGERKLVLHRASANQFGHDRRADRAAEMLLAYDNFGRIPRHVRALDVGAVASDGRLLSLADTGEFFVLTSYAEGHPYAEELRALAQRGHADERDRRHGRALARYLVALHEPVDLPASVYVRSIRDLLGHGEGIFGLVDSYPDDIPGAPASRLRALEHACVEERWRLKRRTARLRRIHGDFHPFNVLFDDRSSLSLLDASRGCAGDPADDLTAMSVNYLFFALQHPGSWREGFAPLWNDFWQSYLAMRSDQEVLEVAPLFLTWRLLVVANPCWYPHVAEAARDALLSIAEHVLAERRLDPTAVGELVGG